MGVGEGGGDELGSFMCCIVSSDSGFDRLCDELATEGASLSEEGWERSTSVTKLDRRSVVIHILSDIIWAGDNYA